MSLEDLPDIYEDIKAVTGADLVWSFELQPFDVSGCTAVFRLTDTGQTFPIELLVLTDQAEIRSRFTLRLTPLQLASLTPGADAGIWSYRVLLTLTNGQVVSYGHGSLILE